MYILEILPALLRTAKRRWDSRKTSRPAELLPVIKPNMEDFLADAEDAIIWFGHSSLLIKLSGKIILCDPVLSSLPWLVRRFTGKRFTKELPISWEDMPYIDYWVQSHNHYDHLDYVTVQKLKEKVGIFLVPQGVGELLQKWGVAPTKIKEFTYEESFSDEVVTFICTPSQHFSGRGLGDRDKSLWCSWVLKGMDHSIFFGGDGAYNGDFKKIAATYGPFDVSLLECGQANRSFSFIHMTPENTIKAQRDLKSRFLIPIHWGLFSQSNPIWNKQVDTLFNLSIDANIAMYVPRHGEVVHLNELPKEQKKWWLDF